MAFRPLLPLSLLYKSFTSINQPLLALLFFTLSHIVQLCWTTATPTLSSLSLSLSSMTPGYLNPPPSPFSLVDLKEDDHHVQLFIPVPHEPASSVLRPIFFNTIQDQRGSILQESHHVEKVEKHISHSGSSTDGHIFASSSSLKPVLDDGNSSGHKLSLCKEDGDESRNDNGSVKWMSSKMRLMQRMMNSNCALNEKPARVAQKFYDRQHDNKEINLAKNGNNTVRVCSDCNTTTTPLWRSGPRGPKSLCNACGIRQRKARRAMAEAAAAANGMVIATDQTSSMKAKVHNKEKKSRTSHFAQIKKQYCKPPDPSQSQKKLCFTDFALSLSKNSSFQRVFPQDEEEAAILLMELSCGLVHS